MASDSPGRNDKHKSSPLPCSTNKRGKKGLYLKQKIKHSALYTMHRLVGSPWLRSFNTLCFLTDIYSTDLVRQVPLFQSRRGLIAPTACIRPSTRDSLSKLQLWERGEENTVICPQFKCIAKPCFVPPFGFCAEEWNLPLSSVSLAELFITLSCCGD